MEETTELLEFVVEEPEQLPQQINGNFDELKKSLELAMQKYNSIVVTPESIAAATKTRANLNKLKTAIDKRRIEIKNKWCAPLEVFESKAKDLTALIDEPIGIIDKQVKAFESQRIEEKRTALFEQYSTLIGDLDIPFERFFDDKGKWKNKGEKLDSLISDLKEKISRCKSDIKIIEKTCGNYVAACQQKYLDTLNISDALAEFKKLEELDKRRAIIEAEEKKRAEEKAKAVDVELVPTAKPSPVPQEIPPTATAFAEATKTIEIHFDNTTAAFRAEMKALCIKHNIHYCSVSRKE